MVTRTEKALVGGRIGLFGKGGSGKSTAAVLLARALRDRDYEVCVVDADSTNVGLNQAMGIQQAPVALLDYFGGMVFSGGLVTCPVDDPTPLPGSEISLDRLPSKYWRQDDEGIWLLTAGKIGDQGPGAGCDGPIAKIARDLRISHNGQSPVTLIDFKAGFEDSARGAVTSLDWVLVIVDPTTAAVRMAVNMRDMVDQIKAGGLPATQHLETPELVQWANRIFQEATVKGVLVVLNRIANEKMDSHLREKLAKHAIEPVGLIHEDPDIAMSWLRGAALEAGNTKADVERIVEKLEAAEKAYRVDQG